MGRDKSSPRRGAAPSPHRRQAGQSAAGTLPASLGAPSLRHSSFLSHQHRQRAAELPLPPSREAARLCLSRWGHLSSHKAAFSGRDPSLFVRILPFFCGILAFCKASPTRGARALPAFTTPWVHFWHIVNTYVCTRIYFAGLDRKPRNDFSPRLHLVIQHSPCC